MQAVVYTRISRDREGAGLGVERQKADCLDAAQRLGWTVVETYTDNDISAYSARRRPGYEAMCADLEAGKAQGLVVWHADRLHRRPLELESFIDLCDRRGILVQTVKSGNVDLSTASGRMVARMLGASARHEVEHSIERQKRAKYQAAVDGKYRGGRRSFGYEPDGNNLRADEANAVRAAVDAILSGVSLRQIARQWNEQGLRTSYGSNEFNSREVRKILLRPRNAGYSLHNGERIPNAQWTPILDADTFSALEAFLADPARSTRISYERKHMGSGVYVCGKCGAKISTATQNAGKNTKHWRLVYVCGVAKHLGRVAEYVDEYISEVVIQRLSRPDAAIVLGGGAEIDLPALQTKREGCRARLDELGSLFAAGDIDGQQLKRATAELRQQLDAVEGELAAVRSSSALADLVLAGDDLRETWKATPPDIKGKIIDALMTVTILPTGRGRRPGGGYFDPASVAIEWRQQ